MTLKEQVIEMCKDLRLPSIRKLVKEETSFPHPEQAFKILHQVLVQEKEDRFIRAKQNRIRLANFPQKKVIRGIVHGGVASTSSTKNTHFETIKLYQGRPKCHINRITWYRENAHIYWVRNGSLFSRI